MPETAWPFLIGRARNEDYRFVVIPEIMTDSSLAAALRASTSGDPGEHGTALVREIEMTPRVPVTVVYRVRPARAEDYRVPGNGLLTDVHGRPILLTEGMVIRCAASSVMASGVPQAALDHAHDLVTPAFQQFWAGASDFIQQVGKPFAVPPASSPGPSLRLELTGPTARVRTPISDVPTVADPGMAPVPADITPEGSQWRGGLQGTSKSRGRSWAIAAFVLGVIVLVALVLIGVLLLATRVLVRASRPGPRSRTQAPDSRPPAIRSGPVLHPVTFCHRLPTWQLRLPPTARSNDRHHENRSKIEQPDESGMLAEPAGSSSWNPATRSPNSEVANTRSGVIGLAGRRAPTIGPALGGPGPGYPGGRAWRVISMATTSVIRSVPGGRGVSWSRRVTRTRRAIELGGGSGLRVRWSL
jgi:hypothetical protein